MDTVRILNAETVRTQRRSRVNFLELSPANKLTILQKVENSTENVSKEVNRAYLDFKQQTIAFYLSSEEIGEKFLNYLPVPGEYIACISPDEVGGKAWSI